MSPNIPLTAWAPDADPTIPGVAADVENMLPTKRGYAAEAGLGTLGATRTLPSACLGAGYLRFSNYSPHPFFGTSTGLYSAFGSVVDITGGTITAVSELNAWRFASIADIALAVSKDNVLKSTNNPSTDFADVSGAPSGDTIAVQEQFVMIGATNSGGWVYPDGWWCSARGDETDWTPDVATQCAQGRLNQTPGRIVRLIPFQKYIVAFKNSSMLRGTYVGAPVVWRWDVINTSIGLTGHEAVCEAEGALYWLGYDGFYRFAGGAVERIQSAPMDWFRRSGTTLFNSYQVQAQWDSVRRCVRWYYALAGETALTRCIAYHVDTDRWGKSEVEIEWVCYGYAESVIDATGSVQAVVDAPTVVRGTTHAIETFAGDMLDSSITTGDIGDDQQVFTLTQVRTRYYTQPTTVSATNYYRQTLDASLTTDEQTTRSDGKFDFSRSARWHRIKLEHTGAVEMGGFGVQMQKAGKR